MARNQVEVGVRNGSEEQRFARFQFRDLDFVSIVVDLDDVADRALWGAIGPMLIAPGNGLSSSSANDLAHP